MRDLDDRFRSLARTRPPNLWPDIERREARGAASQVTRRRSPLAAIGVALALAVAATVLTVRAFQTTQPSIGEVSSIMNGKIAFSGFDGSTWQIYVVNPDGSGLQQLTHLRGESAIQPAWSPDGSRVAYVVQTSAQGGGAPDIHVMNADGSNDEVLAGGPGWQYLPSWSPDGTRIAFVSNEDGNDEIYVVAVDRSGKGRLTNDPDEDLFPTWSPDMARIAFVSNRDGVPQVYVMDADGGRPTNVSRLPAGGAYDPAWSPDGSKIAFASDGDGDPEIYVMDADGSGVTRLTEDPGHDWTPAWSPDGSMLVFESDRADQAGLYVMKADGSGVRELGDIPMAYSPAWQPIPRTPVNEVQSPAPTAESLPDVEPRIATTSEVGPLGQTTAMVYAAGSVWVTAYGVEGGGGVDRNMLFQIDPRAEVVNEIPLETSPSFESAEAGLTFDGDSIWVTGGGRTPGGDRGPEAILQRIDPSTAEVVATIPLGGSWGADVSVNDAGVWVGIFGEGHAEVVRVDPATDQVVARVPLESNYVSGIEAVADGVLLEELEWTNDDGPCGFLTTIDPNTNEILTRSAIDPPCGIGRLVMWRGQVWASLAGGFVQLDPRTAQTIGAPMAFEEHRGPRGFLAAGESGIWYAAYPGGNGNRSDSLARLDPATGKIRYFMELPGANAAALTETSIWVLNYDGSLTRVDIA